MALPDAHQQADCFAVPQSTLLLINEVCDNGGTPSTMHNSYELHPGDHVILSLRVTTHPFQWPSAHREKDAEEDTEQVHMIEA